MSYPVVHGQRARLALGLAGWWLVRGRLFPPVLHRGVSQSIYPPSPLQRKWCTLRAQVECGVDSGLRGLRGMFRARVNVGCLSVYGLVGAREQIVQLRMAAYWGHGR